MSLRLGMMAGAGSAAIALALTLAPAGAAPASDASKRARPAATLRAGTFTPAVSDPRLAAELARRGYQPSGFRFTPAPTALNRSQSLRIAVRARADAPVTAVRRVVEASATPVTAITPTVYNVGASLGWKSFAISGDVDRVKGGSVPGGRDAAQVDVSYAMKRFTGRVEVGASRAEGTQAQLAGEDKAYSLGVGGSFRLMRNLDVTGGVRYQVQRDRLEAIADQRRDSQAVYVGTAFRF